MADDDEEDFDARAVLEALRATRELDVCHKGRWGVTMHARTWAQLHALQMENVVACNAGSTSC